MRCGFRRRKLRQRFYVCRRQGKKRFVVANDNAAHALLCKVQAFAFALCGDGNGGLGDGKCGRRCARPVVFGQHFVYRIALESEARQLFFDYVAFGKNVDAPMAVRQRRNGTPDPRRPHLLGKKRKRRAAQKDFQRRKKPRHSEKYRRLCGLDTESAARPRRSPRR